MSFSQKIQILGAQSAVDQATAVTAVNALLNTLVTVTSVDNIQPINVSGFSTGVAVGPIFTVACIVNFDVY